MKKVFIVLIILLLSVQSCIDIETSGASTNTKAAMDTTNRSANSVVVPTLTNFPERQTIARWATTFDVPEITCYIYLINYGNIIGYYVTNGKPASTQSYLTPSYKESYYSSGGVINTELPDIDGTYGDNQSGVRFFTASGIAVEWAGNGATYLFSTQKLPINAPELGR